MFEAAETMSIPSLFGEKLKRWVFALQDYTLLSIQSIANVFTPPQYWRDTLEQMDLIGVGSLSIVAIAALFIGGVTVLDTASQFSRFGMTALTGEAVSIAMVRELGPTITALLVAGRNASGIASELGSMVVTEQIDAMRALGTDPIRKLMTPRVLATIFVLPLLVAIADFLGLVGGYIMAYLTLRVGAVQFWTQAVDSLAFGDLITGLAKPHYRDDRLLSGVARSWRNGRRGPRDNLRCRDLLCDYSDRELVCGSVVSLHFQFVALPDR
jgi:phospholipid/cholesterol/gamma-HCH transport system permease protein